MVLDWKKLNVLDFELKKFGRVRFWKNVCIQKITFWFFLLRENDIFCIFTAFLKGKILNWKFQYKSDFDLKDLQRVGFGIEKKHLQSRIERVNFFLKKTQDVIISVKSLTTFERRIGFWQLPAVHLATKSTTDIVVSFFPLKQFGFNGDRKHLHSVRTWKTR